MKDNKAVKKYCRALDERLEEVADALQRTEVVDQTGSFTEAELSAVRVGAINALALVGVLVERSKENKEASSFLWRCSAGELAFLMTKQSLDFLRQCKSEGADDDR